MTTPDINAMFIEETIPSQDLSDLPKEVSRPKDPPQPGTYRLTLPGNFSGIIKPFESAKGQRAMAMLTEENALEDQLGQKIDVIIDNSEYLKKDKKSGRESYVSGMGFLLGALGHSGALDTNASFANALVSYAGASLKADLSYSAYCNPKRKVWKNGGLLDQTGCSSALEQEGYTKRNGQEVRSIPRGVDGRWLSKLECNCGAELRVRTRLSNYRSI